MGRCSRLGSDGTPQWCLGAPAVAAFRTRAALAVPRAGLATRNGKYNSVTTLQPPRDPLGGLRRKSVFSSTATTSCRASMRLLWSSSSPIPRARAAPNRTHSTRSPRARFRWRCLGLLASNDSQPIARYSMAAILAPAPATSAWIAAAAAACRRPQARRGPRLGRLVCPDPPALGIGGRRFSGMIPPVSDPIGISMPFIISPEAAEAAGFCREQASEKLSLNQSQLLQDAFSGLRADRRPGPRTPPEQALPMPLWQPELGMSHTHWAGRCPDPNNQRREETRRSGSSGPLRFDSDRARTPGER